MNSGNVVTERLANGEIVLLDGAISTELQRRGVPVDRISWFGSANLHHLDEVQALHEDYIRAGADVIIANTHSTNRAGLEPAGLGGQVEELNRRAVRAAIQARQAVPERQHVAIAGSISSFIPAAMGSPDTTDLRSLATFREQANILADALPIRTVGHLQRGQAVHHAGGTAGHARRLPPARRGILACRAQLGGHHADARRRRRRR